MKYLVLTSTLLLSISCSNARESDQRAKTRGVSNATSQCLNIVGGTEDRSGRYSGVVALRQGDTFCTGSLITPRAILTAAHCLGNSADGSVEVLANDFISVVAKSIAVADLGGRGMTIDPKQDAAIIYLDKKLNLAPLALDLRPPSEIKPQPVRIVGYGYNSIDQAEQQSSGLSGRRYIGENFMSVTFENGYWLMASNLSNPSPSFMSLNGNQNAITAPGDSGGPLLSTKGIIGIVSGGTSNVQSNAFSKYYSFAPSHERETIEEARRNPEMGIALSYFFKINSSAGQTLLSKADSMGIISLTDLTNDPQDNITSQSGDINCN